MILSALILSGAIATGIGIVTAASKGVEDEPKTINHINNNTVINNNQKITNNVNIKNSMNKTSDNNKALEEKITKELNRVEDELMEEMLQQFYMNNLEKEIAEKINKK